MAIGDDIEIQNDKDIRYTGTTANYTALEFHRWLQSLAAGAGSAGDDFMDITKPSPSNKLFDTIIELKNGYNIDDTLAQHLYGGSIIQKDGDEIYDGLAVYAPAGMRMEIIQDGALATNFWTTGLNPDAANGISHRFMLKVRTAGADIDGRRFIAIVREMGYSFLEFKVNGTNRGVNVVALTGWKSDPYNLTDNSTIATWSTITNLVAGYNGMDVNNDGSNEFYYSKWNRDVYTMSQFVERMKYLTRRGETGTLYGLPGQLFRGITHEIVVDGGSGTWNAFEPVTWSGGTGQLLARNHATASSCTKLWIQLITGTPPADNQAVTGTTSGASNLVNVSVTERAVSAPFCGQFTGASIDGAYGFGIESFDLSANDKLTALDAVSYQPPNYVTFTVTGLVAGEDYVFVAANDGGEPDYNQFTLNGALTGAAVTSVTVNEAIPGDTPSTGTLRIQRASGSYSRHPYSAYNAGTKTFTITSHDFSSNAAANGGNAYLSYIDKLAASTSESFTVVYVTDRVLFVRVRDGGSSPTKDYASTATLGSAGGSTTVNRTPD